MPEFVLTELLDPVFEGIGEADELIRNDLLGVSETVLEVVDVDVPAFV